MDLFEFMQEVFDQSNGARICPYCGTPYAPYHSRQKTCGREECKTRHHREYTKRWTEEKMRTNPEQIRASKRQYMRRKRRWEKAEQRMEKLEKYADSIERQDDAVAVLNYGDRQKERTLAQVPKIDVNLPERSNND